jgi:VanZ family protein
MHSVLRLIGAWLLVALYAGGIALASSLSHPPVTFALAVPHVDKLCHFVQFAGLTFLLIRALSSTYTSRAAVSLAIWAALLVALYGASDEIHQAFRPNRVMSGYDLLADAAAAGVVAGGWLWLRRRRSTAAQADGRGPSTPPVISISTDP